MILTNQSAYGKCTCLLLLIFFFIISCNNKKKLFNKISSTQSGIFFNNKIIENDSLNPINVTNIYNGGGVGVGDFNNDGLQDIYFTGNLVPNKLYLNKGKFKFDDITKDAAVEGMGRWARGVSIIDLNNDGWQDIYVSVSMDKDPQKRENLLYINQGLNKSGIPVFKEMAAEYGLNDTTHSTMAAFFDYDNDGDLDMYLVVNEILKRDNPSTFRPKITNGTHPSTGKLFRNDWSPQLKHPVFIDVSKEAGITIEGYGHSVSIADFNKDGYKDIFVTNDFLSNDLLYINNHNGTFTDKAASYFKHTSANGMGQDVIDINNDGLSDVIELDMNPEDNYRKKMMMNANSYQSYQNSDIYGYQYQYVRNTLQLNQGPRVNQGDSTGDPIFSDVAYFSGIAETDWSWTPLVTDFDNDGFRDIIITNGFPKDVTDHDFVAFRGTSFSVASMEYTLEQIPQVKIHNYGFHNNGDVTFSNVTDSWGLTDSSFSNGAVYADLDNDGDMDVVVNNINDEAFLYENTSSDKGNVANRFLSVKLEGDSLNRDGLGTWIELYYQGMQQVYEENPYRGYLSSMQKEAHFGLGNVATIDSVIIKWPNNKKQVLTNVKTNQLLKVEIKDVDQYYNWSLPLVDRAVLLTDITDSLQLQWVQTQKDFIDFNIQKLLPHKFSEYGPALAAGDINGDGLEDIVVGGNSTQGAIVLLQQSSGRFVQKKLPQLSRMDSTFQSIDMGITLFDAEGDGDLDIYITSGGYEAPGYSQSYKDKFLINDGKGNFTLDSNAVPQNLTSKSCVRVADFDHDGDLDIFVAGRVDPWKYPQPVSCYIYRNDSKNGIPKFTDVTKTIAPSLNKIGMVCDAVWTDFDNDGWTDLVLTGEWMPVKFLKNYKGILKDISGASGINNKIGWWSSIVPGDFDNDGDIDFIAGNLGLNSFYKASDQYPVRIYAKDFDNNESYDAIPTIFLPSSQSDTTKKEFPVHTRDDMTKQIISFKAKYQNYKSYATAPFSEMLTQNEMTGALKLEANYFANSYIKNLGGGKFEINALPPALQYSCMNGMLAEDFDGDGKLDLLINGNDFGTEVSVGRYDACNGILLKGNGDWGFTPQSISQSGWFIPGNGKALVKFKNPSGKVLIAASQNKGPLKVYKLQTKFSTIDLQPGDASAKIYYKNGKSRLVNIDYGSSFLSQSGRFLNIDSKITSVEIKDFKGNIRTIKIP
ncbi:MAG: VCBS repeat-containing protein [Ginsengibacter sp.]